MDEITPPPYLPSQPPQRHGCLTTWLILIIVGSAFTVLATPFSMAAQQRAGLHSSLLTTAVLVVCGVVNIGCAIALFRWMKVGFYGLAATSIVASIINLIIGVPIFTCILGLVGLAILYAVLNIGGPNKAWPQLH